MTEIQESTFGLIQEMKEWEEKCEDFYDSQNATGLGEAVDVIKKC